MEDANNRRQGFRQGFESSASAIAKQRCRSATNPDGNCSEYAELMGRKRPLSPAEAAFALEIVKGDGRQAAADRLDISVGTARSHLSSIFDKTGSRR